MKIQWTIGKKLFASFMSLAAIVVILGGLGFWGAMKSADAVNEIGNVHLPSIENLLVIQAAAENVRGTLRTLTISGLAPEMRQRQYDNLTQARERYRKAWQDYDALPLSREEQEAWRRLAPIWQAWENEVDRAGEMARQVDANGIAYPMELSKQLEGFSRDHYVVVEKTLELIMNRSRFEGGEDHTACNAGRWMPDFQSINRAMMNELRGMVEPHRRFHENVARIKQLVAANDLEGARRQYQQEMLPAMQDVFGHFSAMMAVADESVELEAGMRRQLLGPVTERQREATALLNQLITLGNQIAEQEVGAAQSLAVFLEVVSLVALLIGLALAITIAVVITRSLTRPIAKTVAMLEEMGKGRLESRLNLVRDDEIGTMAKTMDRFADTLQNEVVAALQKLAQGDLTFTAKPHDERDLIGNALVKTNEDLNRIVGEILAATEQIAAGSGQVSSSSQSLSQGATESAASLEQITSSMTEMASQTKLNAENSTQANQLAGEARKAAETGNEQMEKMMAAMGDINQAGQNISKIIKVIDEIAFQTNLLALNAAVEAARAGRHGKGFAVVAEEVRNLAARSAKAAKETAELIEGSVAKTENGTAIAARTAESLKEIVTAISKATDLVGEIAAASNEQAQGIGQVNEGLSQIDQVTQTNTANAEEGAAAAEELSSQADHLRGLMGAFTVKGGGQRGQRALPAAPEPRRTSGDGGGFKGWDSPTPAGGRKLKASEVIALDDREFGRY